MSKAVDAVWPSASVPANPTTTPIVRSAAAHARPAPSASPPVLVENITPLKSNAPGGSFALPQPLPMSPAELSTFNALYPRSAEFESWYAKHDGTAVGSGTLTMTLRGNGREQVRITDIKALKNCAAPLDGTYFQGPSQGSPDNLKIGFDLDSSEPSAEVMAFSGGRGWFLTGERYFDIKTVSLNPGEVETLSFEPFTKSHSCTFTFRIFVATPSGTYFQDVDQGGAPFRVTAQAPPKTSGVPLSGYHAVYARTGPNGPDLSWQQVDPATYRG
jgi:hypothetical protein